MMAVKLLVKIAVMMMAPGGTPAPPEARGRESTPPPSSSSSSLTFSLGGRRVSPLVLGLHGVGGARAPPRLVLSLSLSVSALWSAALSSFRIYMEIRNSDWPETFTQYMSVSHGYSTIGGIEYDDGGYVEKTKNGRKYHIDTANQRAMEMPIN